MARTRNGEFDQLLFQTLLVGTAAFVGYKWGRRKMAEELAPQLEPAYGVPQDEREKR